MDLKNRISLMEHLGEYLVSKDPQWLEAKERAYRHNPWFIPAFIDRALEQISNHFLRPGLLEQWLRPYAFPNEPAARKTIGLVMAGNIPLVGFHDFLSVFLSGHRQLIKLSAKDQELMPALLEFLYSRCPESRPYFATAPMLKGCDAYIATGSSNTARYFDYYFGKYPSLIRRNRTSVAILSGAETAAELDALADDAQLYFGLGCRNVTKIFVPEGYRFEPLLEAFRKYDWMASEHRYKNNYDYQLSLAILNKREYMTNSSVLLLESPSVFSPISILHYGFYQNGETVFENLPADQIQGFVGAGYIPFGKSQEPGLLDYPDGADTLSFLRNC